jgi:ABC-type multidrug transport system fused ATPase/permease subunit
MAAFFGRLKGYRHRIALSLLLAMAEAGGIIVLPFLIGRALDDYLDGSHRGLIGFASVGVMTMLLATVRRLHDARLYARVYQKVAADALEQEIGLSEKTARLNMTGEVIEFLEYSMPELVANLSAFVGILVFLAALSVPVLAGALIMSLLIVAIYAATSMRTVALNRQYNDEYERQVDVLGRNDRAHARRHVGLLNRWSIKLSDVDTINYALTLSLTIALQLAAIVIVTRQGMEEGAVLSVVLYVFEFSATASYLPDAWQQYLRLREILQRLRAF